jgi:hypothetical protein
MQRHELCPHLLDVYAANALRQRRQFLLRQSHERPEQLRSLRTRVPCIDEWSRNADLFGECVRYLVSLWVCRVLTRGLLQRVLMSR